MISKLMRYKLNAYGLSDMGLVRQNNEDVWGSVPEYNIFILADGMGGHQSGEVAAKETLLFLSTNLRDKLSKENILTLSLDEIRNIIKISIENTNRNIYEMSLTHELLRGMGTTLCCLYFHDDSVFHAHVGDSRIYRFQNQKLEQLTQDHSLLRELIDLGKVQGCDTEEFLYKNIITRAIGTDPVVEPTVNVSTVAPNSTYLLCSDGLSDLITKDEMSSILNKPFTIEEKVRALIAAAKQKGGYDNVTVVLIEVKEEDDEKKDLSRQ